MIGDLNNVVTLQDKSWDTPYPTWLIEGFNEAQLDAGLRDMDLIGHQYTWEKGRGTEDWMDIRLDRALFYR